MDAFLQLEEFSEIRDFTPWNEPNNTGFSPLADKPELAGQMWFVLGEACRAVPRTCNIAAGDFLDSKMQNPNAFDDENDNGQVDPDESVSVGKAYFDAYRRGMAYQPCIWAWHPYTDGQETVRDERDREERWRILRNFCIATQSSSDNGNERRCGSADTMTNRSPSIWISEVGAMRQQRKADNTLKIDNSDEVQVSIMRMLVNEIPEESERIKRFYYYHWSADSSSFDSALLYRGSCSGCADRPGWDAFRVRPKFFELRDATR